MGLCAIAHRWVTVFGLACLVAACGGAGVDPPAITAQPQAATVADGSSATFSVSTTGGAPLSFQWQRNGVAIPGATSASYTTSPLNLADSRSAFRVTVSNAVGSVTSQTVAVQVNPVAPAIDVQPMAATVADGTSASFSVHATGSQPQSYQWLRNGVPVPGANTASIVVDPASLTDSGATFSVQVSNAAGSVTSQAVALSVTPVVARITGAPQAQTVLDGATASFAVSAVGSAALRYQWYADGAPIAGATAVNYSVVATYADSGKQISVRVSNPYGSDTSVPVALRVDPRAPAFVAAPQDVAVQVGGSASFLVTASGTVPMSFQWERSNDGGVNWGPIAGAMATTFDIANATLAWHDARLRVRVTNVAGSMLSGTVALRLTPNVHIIAGTVGGSGFADGSGNQVRFNLPSGTAVDAQGNIFVADRFNSVIRKIAPSGVATTVAGRVRVNGLQDGPAAAALFNFPEALALDAAGNLYVGDSTLIRKIATDGTVSTVAGQRQAGSGDGTGSIAAFSAVRAIVSDATGNLVVVDGAANQTVRRVSRSGVVTTLAGSAGSLGDADGQGAAARFRDMSALAVDAAGNYFVADDHSVRRVTPDGTVALFAGAPGVPATIDGPRLLARFGNLSGLGFDRAGSLYLAEDSYIRRITPDGNTITLAGGGVSTGGDRDGTGGTAYLHYPTGMTPTPDGTRFIFTGRHNSTVRSVTLGGTVNTVAGVSPQYAHVDGPGTTARFFATSVIASDAHGSVYTPEFNSVRRIDSAGTVLTLTLRHPNLVNISAIALDAAGTVFLADNQLHQIFRVAPDGSATVLAGIAGVTGHQDGPASLATFLFPGGLAVDRSGNVFVADTQNGTIRKIDTAGMVTTVAGRAGQCGNVDGVGPAALFCHPMGMAFDAQGRLYVADDWAHTIRRITSDGTVVTFGGAPFAAGLSNGFVSRFKGPTAVAFDVDGNLYVADTGNSVVRRVMADGIASTVIGQVGVMSLQTGAGGAINQPTGIAVLPNGRIVFTSELAVVGD